MGVIEVNITLHSDWLNFQEAIHRSIINDIPSVSFNQWDNIQLDHQSQVYENANTHPSYQVNPYTEVISQFPPKYLNFCGNTFYTDIYRDYNDILVFYFTSGL